jgi:hypothetical protein
MRITLVDPLNPNNPLVLAASDANVVYFLWASDPGLSFTNRYLRIADAMDTTVFGQSSPFSVSAPAAQINVATTPNDAWTAGKEVRVTWTKAGVADSALCTVEIWSVAGEYPNAQVALSLTGTGAFSLKDKSGLPLYPAGVPCGLKGGLKFTPPVTLDSQVRYYAFIITADGTTAAGRSDPPVPLFGGELPPALSGVVASNRRRARQLGHSSEARILAAAFPDLSGQDAAILSAASCDACVAAGGAYVLDTGYTYSIDVTGTTVMTADDKEQLALTLGQMKATDNFCWRRPQQGQTRAGRVMAIGRTPALDAKVKGLGLPSTIVARATLTLDADVSGATECKALELVSLPFTVPVALADIATFDSAAVCSALTAAVAAAGG